MRMWMVNPRLMCRKHLLGEHVECHMFLGTLKRGISVQGYFDHNCFEPDSLKERHEELAREMRRRNYRHESPLPVARGLIAPYQARRIDREQSRQALFSRCSSCGVQS